MKPRQTDGPLGAARLVVAQESNGGQREHKGSLRDIRKKSFAPALPQKIWAISSLKLPSF